MCLPRLLCAGVAVVAMLAASCSRESSAPPAPLRLTGAVVVVIDALRRDRLGVYGNPRRPSPQLDALAAAGTRFDNALTPAPWTLPAMGSLWTSLYPSAHGATRWTNEQLLRQGRKDFKPVSVLGESSVTLAEILRANGFRTAAFIDGAYTGPVFGMTQGFERVVEDELYGVRLNSEALLAWLGETRPQRFFAYLHAVEVHSPYVVWGEPVELRGRKDPAAQRVRTVLEEERRAFRQIEFDPDYTGSVNGAIATLRRLRESRQVDPRDLEHLLALYDRGLAYVDRWVGALVEGLKRLGLYDQTIVVVTADHGEEFFEHGGFEHGDTFYDELLRIPLIIRVPGLGQGRHVTEQVSLLDIAPTLLDLLGVPSDLPRHGVSLRPALAGEPVTDRVLFAEANQGQPRIAMRTHRLKYMQNTYQEPRREAYDLESDPRETENLCAATQHGCDRFAAAVEAWMDEVQALAAAMRTAPPATAAIDEQTKERLRSLGYE